MCGIAGFIGRGEERDLLLMQKNILHRGPDQQGIYFKEGVGLAHTRLAIIDTDPRGVQPMWNEKKTLAIVFNGEIYNYRALRDELKAKGKSFSTETDTEVLLTLFEEMGEACFQKLDGMFALAFYDAVTGNVILARDRMGEKPLYYGLFDRTVIFASELPAVLSHPFVKKELDPVSLAAYMVREYVPTPRTMFKNIYKVESGHYIKVVGPRIEKTSFWQQEVIEKDISFKEAEKRLDTLLAKTVADRMISDVPLGVFLSGGIDSATIAYYAQKHSKVPIKTFSIGFNEASFDESSYASLVARVLGTEHYTKIVTAKDALALIDTLGSVMGEPLSDPSIIPTLLLSKFAREKVTVALGGDGGDELFAGYPTFQADTIVSLYKALPALVRKRVIEPLIEFLPGSDKNFSMSFKLQKFIEGVYAAPLERHGRWLGAFSREELKELLTPEVFEVVKQTSPYYEEGREVTSPQEILKAYQHSYLTDQVLVKVDRASMHYALEVRAPFLGKEIVEFVSTLPYRFKLRGLTTKYILKKLMTGKLPLSIVRRQKKGFGIPVAEWLKKDLRPLAETLFSKEAIQKSGVCNHSYVATLFSEHCEGKKNHRKKLWTLFIFQLWAREYMG
jgi:asparagine synthase (glutamine-hydrolysing)